MLSTLTNSISSIGAIVDYDKPYQTSTQKTYKKNSKKLPESYGLKCIKCTLSTIKRKLICLCQKPKGKFVKTEITLPQDEKDIRIQNADGQ